MVEDATNALRYEAAHYPHVNEKPIWITEWNPTGSSWWNGRPLGYFQHDARGQIGGELNKADFHGDYKGMDRAAAIRVLHRDVVEKLRSSATAPINISHVLYYSYDSAGKSPKCDHVKDSALLDLPGFCIDGVIDPSTGNLTRRRHGSIQRGTVFTFAEHTASRWTAMWIGCSIAPLRLHRTIETANFGSERPSTRDSQADEQLRVCHRSFPLPLRSGSVDKDVQSQRWNGCVSAIT